MALPAGRGTQTQCPDPDPRSQIARKGKGQSRTSWQSEKLLQAFRSSNVLASDDSQPIN